MVLTRQQLRDLAASVGFPDPTLAAAIAMGESYGHSDAENLVTPSQAAARGQAPEWSLGIWQINNCTKWDGDSCVGTRYASADLLDPTYNAQVALSISSRGTNWRPWGAFTNGSYRQYLPVGYVPASATPIRPPARQPSGWVTPRNAFAIGGALVLVGFAIDAYRKKGVFA